MKRKFLLKQIRFPFWKDMTRDARMSVEKAEADMRENNVLIEGEFAKCEEEFRAGFQTLEDQIGKTKGTSVLPDLIDMDNSEPIHRFVWSDAITGYSPIFARKNEGLSDYWEVRDDVAFRLTIHGNGIDAVYDCYVKFRGAQATHPDIFVYARTRGTTMDAIGIQFLRSLYPLTLNSGKAWMLECKPISGTARYATIEVYRTNPNITWYEQREISPYNTTYWSNVLLMLYDRRGWVSLNKVYAEVDSATTATYISKYLPAFMDGTLPVAGANLASNALAFMSNNVMYNTADVNHAIDPMGGIYLLTKGFSTGYFVQYNSLQQKAVWSSLQGDGSMTHDTLARGDNVYLKCGMDENGNIYSRNHLSTAMSAGYTWIHIGIASSSTAVLVDTCGKHFYTLNASGKLTHIDGLEIA